MDPTEFYPHRSFRLIVDFFAEVWDGDGGQSPSASSTKSTIGERTASFAQAVRLINAYMPSIKPDFPKSSKSKSKSKSRRKNRKEKKSEGVDEPGDEEEVVEVVENSISADNIEDPGEKTPDRQYENSEDDVALLLLSNRSSSENEFELSRKETKNDAVEQTADVMNMPQPGQQPVKMNLPGGGGQEPRPGGQPEQPEQQQQREEKKARPSDMNKLSLPLPPADGDKPPADPPEKTSSSVELHLKKMHC
eukprot:g5984.t1